MSHSASLTEETTCDHAHDWDWFSNRRETARWDITFWQGPVVSALSCRACPAKGLIWAQAWGGPQLSRRVFCLVEQTSEAVACLRRQSLSGSCQLDRDDQALISMFLLGSKPAQTFLIDLDRERVQPVEPPDAIVPAFNSWQSGFDNQSHWQTLLDEFPEGSDDSEAN